MKILKQTIRFQMLKRLQQQKEVDRLRKSFVIYKKLFGLLEKLRAKLLCFYISFDGEVETWQMIQKALSLGKKVAVPVVNQRSLALIPSWISDCDYSLARGPYGTYQPKPALRRMVPIDAFDVIIVPGVAFDRSGNRLGRGKGYYDRLLRSVPPHVPTVGLAFDFQVLRCLTCLEPHDIAVSHVVSA